MKNEITYCPFCHSVIVSGAEHCSHCGAIIEYGRVPLRYFFLLLLLSWIVIGVIHLLCDDLGIVSFMVQLGVSAMLWLVIWFKSIRVLNKKYKGRIRYVRSTGENITH